MSKTGAPVNKSAPQQYSAPTPITSGKGAKTTGPAPGGCHATGCKSNEARFNFCSEHYDQFKFGLIKKTGEPVSDYEKKFGHYQAYKRKISTQKAA